MRPADINRAHRALEHIDAAMKQLDGIKWENCPSQDYDLKLSVVHRLQDARYAAEDLIRIGGGEV